MRCIRFDKHTAHCIRPDSKCIERDRNLLVLSGCETRRSMTRPALSCIILHLFSSSYNDPTSYIVPHTRDVLVFSSSLLSLLTNRVDKAIYALPLYPSSLLYRPNGGLCSDHRSSISRLQTASLYWSNKTAGWVLPHSL